MWTVILIGFFSMLWTAYGVRRNTSSVRRLAQPWDHNGAPIPVIGIIEDAHRPGRLLGLA